MERRGLGGCLFVLQHHLRLLLDAVGRRRVGPGRTPSTRSTPSVREAILETFWIGKGNSAAKNSHTLHQILF